MYICIKFCCTFSNCTMVRTISCLLVVLVFATGIGWTIMGNEYVARSQWMVEKN